MKASAKNRISHLGDAAFAAVRRRLLVVRKPEALLSALGLGFLSGCLGTTSPPLASYRTFSTETPAKASYDWSVWTTVSKDGLRHIRMDSMSTARPLVTYRLATGKLGDGGGPVELLIEVNCQTRMRRDDFAAIGAIRPNSRTLSVDDLGAEYREEFDFACQWAGAQWSKTSAHVEPVRPALPPPPKRARSTGSGFVVAPQLVITNYHVIDDCKAIKVRLDSEIFDATVRAATERNDLAALAVGRPLGTPATVRTSALLGEDVVVAGHPLSGVLASDLIVTSGQVNSLAGLRDDPNVLQISAPVQPGNSGGPLIDRSGAVVGVVVSKLNVERLSKSTGDFAQNVNFAIKPELLRLFLDANRITYRTSVPTRRLEGFEIATRARAFTVQVICE